MTRYRTRDGDRLDVICHQFYGDTRGTVEAVLQANPSLANSDPVLPAGIVIILPELPNRNEQQNTLRLWD